MWCACHRHFYGDESFGDYATTAGAGELEPGRDEDLRRSLADDERKKRENAFGRRESAYDVHVDSSGSSKL